MSNTRHARLTTCCAATLLLGWLLLGCGGGNEVVAPNPQANGDGLGTITVDGVDLGPQTELVQAIVSDRNQVPTDVTETVTFDGSGTAALSNAPVTSGDPFTMRPDVGGPPYQEAGACDDFDPTIDFVVDRSTGTVTRCDAGEIPPGATVEVSYTYLAELASSVVGVTLVRGDHVSIEVFNLVPGVNTNVLIGETRGAAPADGSRAFTLSMQSDLAEPAGQVRNFILISQCDSDAPDPSCPVVNQLDLEYANLANPSNSCMTGTVDATIAPSTATMNWMALHVEFDDPVCP